MEGRNFKNTFVDDAHQCLSGFTRTVNVLFSELFLRIFLNVASETFGLPEVFWTLDDLERSGRPVGLISTYFHQNSSRGFRAMTTICFVFSHPNRMKNLIIMFLF